MEKGFFKNRRLWWIPVAVLAVAVAIILSVRATSTDTDDIAAHVSERVQSRMDKLDRYASILLEDDHVEHEWRDLPGFPDDMVLYKYVADTLHSWYNLFSVTNDDISEKSIYQRISTSRFSLSSPLSAASDKALYMNLGPRWYIVRMREKGDVKVIEGLFVKDEKINSHIHVHGKYNLDILGQDEGSPVLVDGEPVFKVVSPDGSSHQPSILAGFIFDQFFSPMLYAHDGLLNSFGTLIIFNTLIFLLLLTIFRRRRQIGERTAGSKRRRTAALSCFGITLLLVTAYGFYTFVSLIYNSGIELELYRLNTLSWYTPVVYVSYAFLFAGLFLLLETMRGLYPRTSSSRTLLRLPVILIFAFVCSFAVGVISASAGFDKEHSRIVGLSNRLAVDRNLRTELSLMAVDASIASDPVLSALSFVQGSGNLLASRLNEMYFRRFVGKYDVDVNVMSGYDPHLRKEMEDVNEGSVQISPDSHFLYKYDPIHGSHYTGVFQFYDEGAGLAIVFIDVRPKIGGNGGMTGGETLPPYYSYAKYYDGKLVSFSGTYAYPTGIRGIVIDGEDAPATFVREGYRHFINRISSDETIVISRRERSVTIYLVSVTYLTLLLFLVLLLFKPRLHEEKYRAGYFSTRMRRLIVMSLVVTLLIMAAISVLFVYNRNERNLENIMSGKISTIQVMLDGACRTIADTDGMRDAAFMAQLREIAGNTNSDIILYTPSGRLFLGSSPAIFASGSVSSRINPEAFKKIMLSQRRYFINRETFDGNECSVLYAPVIGSTGQLIAIASTPYTEKDYDFMMDAVFHASSIISLFLILLFITILVTSSMTGAIFKPLLTMSQKMRNSDLGGLEQIDYKGDDEISALVGAYNNMVVDLQESTARLAVAERDKAWSEMARQVAHEIKNPLTPIKLEIQRLVRLKQKNDPSWSEKFDTVSAVVLEHIDILAQTANEFSTFAKLYSEPPVEINLDAVLRDQLLLFGDKGVQITYLGTADAVVKGPKPQLIRVFVNLLTNAVQAVDGIENPQVTVSLRKGAERDSWDIVFEDNGPGVPEENLDKLFTPNFTTKSSGTGLGLAICHSIIDKCGGRIAYSRSFTLGGACFTVTLFG
ncbi:MAG: HAMP domain-containing histidine kinase [Bacteroidales bacterium]|nr:HAMP domain-containing histidine kinase [Bacteroidales bacterium]